MKKDDAWFQYYYDVVGYPHADDEKGTTREISPHLKWRFGVKSQAHVLSNIKYKVLVFFIVWQHGIMKTFLKLPGT